MSERKDEAVLWLELTRRWLMQTWPELLDEHEAELERDCVPLDGEE